MVDLTGQTQTPAPSRPRRDGASSLLPQRVRVRKKRLEDYRQLVGDDLVDQCRDMARELRGLRTVDLSSTATGGGVAELLTSVVPLLRDLGIEAEWDVIPADTEFFNVTKKLHNGMQGAPGTLSAAERATYLSHNSAMARRWTPNADVIVVHDPQPAAVRSMLTQSNSVWIWRCHVDSSDANRSTWEFLSPLVELHDFAVFTLDEFVPEGLSVPVRMILPAIDPLNSKNRELPAYLARETAGELGVDLGNPLLLQVSRFDPWKDPLGVIEVWREVRKEFPRLQLTLVGTFPSDDPEGWRIYRAIECELSNEHGCLLLTDRMGVANHEVNALQRVADVAIQKSTREGFGLVVAETLWKGTAMVAGNAGGIPVQLHDKTSGFLAESKDEYCERISDLLRHPSIARRLGESGRADVTERFLIPRLLRDHLALLREAAGYDAI